MYNVCYMQYLFSWDPKKDIHLTATRWISFEDVLTAIEWWGLLDILDHPIDQYKHQKLFVITWQDYTYIVPAVLSWENNFFLKTIIPSRKYHKIYS
jgi:hypothetical protein